MHWRYFENKNYLQMKLQNQLVYYVTYAEMNLAQSAWKFI